jgi:hypothetical protein
MTVLRQEVWMRALVLIMSGIGTILIASPTQAQT